MLWRPAAVLVLACGFVSTRMQIFFDPAKSCQGTTSKPHRVSVLTQGWALGHQQAKLQPLLGLQCPTGVSFTTSRCSTRAALPRGALTFQAMLRTGALELLEDHPGSRFEVLHLPRVISCLPCCKGWQLSEIVSSTLLLRGVKMKVTAPLLSPFRALSAYVGTMLFRACVCV